jgi:hypothetical protein
VFRKLLLVNGLFTAIGGIIFIFVPNQLMRLFGIQLLQKEFFIYFLLGVTSLSFAFLSFSAMKLADHTSLRIVAATFLIFHAAEAAVGIYEFAIGLSVWVLITVGVHVVFSALFWRSGLQKNPA